MNTFLEEIKKYCNDDTVENICVNYPKSFGIEADLSILTEKNKCIGKIIYENNSTKLKLGIIVEFDEKKIKWKSSRFYKNFGFYIVDQYWCKHYAPVPKINVPVEIFNEKENKIELELQKMSFEQFMKRKLFSFYKKFAYKYVAAYDNFFSLISSKKPYYYCINCTVRNYHVSQKDLQKIITVINHEKKRIKTEWNNLLNESIRNDKSIEMMNKLYSQKSNENNSANVIKFKKK